MVPRLGKQLQMTGSYRVFRGGVFSYFAQNARSAGRAYGTPGVRDGSIGALVAGRLRKLCND